MKKKITRRETLRLMAVTAAGTLVACRANDSTAPAATATAEPTATQPPPVKSTDTPQPTDTPTAQPTPTETPTAATSAEGKSLAAVYMTKTISADGLMQAYAALGRKASGRVAVKIHSGEPGGHNYLPPDFIVPLVKEVNGTIVECDTAYQGRRFSPASHQLVMEEHGFAAIAPVDIMDAEGTMRIPITGGKHLTEVVVGSHFATYDFVVNLAHFKGHPMGGFGGVIKNMSIGIASSMGKSLIHSAGKETIGLGMTTPQDEFLESMAEAAKGMADYLGEKIVYIDVMRKLSVDCDCLSNPAAPTMNDIGILASLDPVALDQACVDLVYAAPDGKDLIARMESHHGIHTLEHAEAIGLGSRKYSLVSID